MKRLIIIVLMTMLTGVGVRAQSSMSDSQIISFIQKEQKSGTSQQQIVVKLMQKGVTIERLQEVRKKYEKMGGQNAQGARNLTGEAGKERARNGETQAGGNQSPLQRMGFQNQLDEQNEQYAQMRTELGEFMPDSTEAFDKEMARMIIEQSKRKIFGHDIFNNRNLTFEPNMNIATPQDYILGPGDAVFVDIYGASQKTLESTVSPDGYITVEGFGLIPVSGLTVQQADRKVRQLLSQRYSSSQIKLTVGETKTMMVNVMGEVAAPGTYTLSAFASVFHALYMAGGVNEIGTLRDIKVYRKNKLVSSVDIYDYILNGKLTGNVRLADGDVIVVGPYDCLVNITGKVKRPMFYEMKQGESLATAVKYAGGFSGDAYRNMVRVVRKAGKEYTVWNVAEFEMGTFNLCDEDSVSVDSVIARYENAVELRGAALRPGMYQIGERVSTVRDLINIADGLQDYALTDHVILHRMRADRTLEVHAFNLTAVLNGSEPDVSLQNEDVIFIPSKEDKNQSLTLKIFGEVYYPGQYQYAEGMTVEDFILQAGGLKEGADKRTVTVSRREVVPAGSQSDLPRGTRAKTIEITMKEGFVIDGKEGFKLLPFDEVYVNKDPNFRAQASVEVVGEVMVEGTYSLSSDNTRVSDVLSMCGGVTAQAAKNGAYILRKYDTEEARRRTQLLDKERTDRAYRLSQGSQLANDEKLRITDSLLVEQHQRQDYYKLAVNLGQSIANPGSEDDVILRDGDRLVVEERRNTVKVSGSVPYPNAVPFVKGKAVKYYMGQAGARGRKNRKWAYIIYQNGSSEMVKAGAKPEPGCEIVLPERNTSSNSIQNISIISSLLATLTTLGAVVVSVLK